MYVLQILQRQQAYASISFPAIQIIANVCLKSHSANDLFHAGTMSGTLLEQTRAAHEECERQVPICNLHLIPFFICSRARSVDELLTLLLQLNFCVGDLRKQPKVHRERLLQQVRVRKRMDRIVECSRKLLKTYDDVDGARKDEMASMTGTEAFKVFFCV
jgi:splicing factor 3A subunit 3